MPAISSTLLLVNIALMVSIEFLQNAMVAFGSSYISGGVGAAPEQFSLAAAVYAGTAILMISRHRWFVGHLGYRNFVRLSLLLFVIGAVLCARSTSVTELIVGRFVQALGGSAFFTTARVQVTRFPHARRLQAITFFAFGILLSSGAAAWLASVALSLDSWRVIFLVPVPVALVVGILSELTLQADANKYPENSTSHLRSTMLLAIGVIAAQYFFERTPYDLFGDHFKFLLISAFALACLIAFIVHELGNDQPILRLGTILRPRYLAGLALYATCYMIISSSNYMLPIFMDRGINFAKLPTGEILSSASMFALIVTGLHLRYASRFPSQRKYLYLAFAALAAFGFFMSGVSPDVPSWQISVACLGLAVFTGIGQATAALNTFSETPDDAFSDAYQVKNMLRELMNSTGISLATVLLQSRTALHYARLAEHVNIAELQTQDNGYFASLVGLEPSTATLQSLVNLVNQQATLGACLDFFFLLGVIGAVGVIVSSFQRRIV